MQFIDEKMDDLECLPVGVSAEEAAEAVDIRDLVDSIYNDRGIFPGEKTVQLLHLVRSKGFPSCSGGLPDSPPDSGSERAVLSPPSLSTMVNMDPNAVKSEEQDNICVSPEAVSPPRMAQCLPDLNAVDYSAPLQVMEGTTVDSRKRKRKELAPEPPPLLASSNSNIRFFEHQRECWHSTADANLTELPPITLSAAADKGFNYSSIDEAYIAQKKNHFQLTCQVWKTNSIPVFYLLRRR